MDDRVRGDRVYDSDKEWKQSGLTTDEHEQAAFRWRVRPSSQPSVFSHPPLGKQQTVLHPHRRLPRLPQDYLHSTWLSCFQNLRHQVIKVFQNIQTNKLQPISHPIHTLNLNFLSPSHQHLSSSLLTQNQPFFISIRQVFIYLFYIFYSSLSILFRMQ